MPVEIVVSICIVVSNRVVLYRPFVLCVTASLHLVVSDFIAILCPSASLFKIFFITTKPNNRCTTVIYRRRTQIIH